MTETFKVYNTDLGKDVEFEFPEVTEEYVKSHIEFLKNAKITRIPYADLPEDYKGIPLHLVNTFGPPYDDSPRKLYYRMIQHLTNVFFGNGDKYELLSVERFKGNQRGDAEIYKKLYGIDTNDNNVFIVVLDKETNETRLFVLPCSNMIELTP